MSRASLFHWWKVGIIALTVLLLGAAVVVRPVGEMRTALVFAALVLVASFLRIEMGDASIGFEAAVVFGAIVIFHSPAVALVSVLIGTAAHATYRAVADRAWRLEPFYNAAQLALSYSIVGLLYSIAVAQDADAAAKMAGFTLLLVGYVGVHLLFVSVRRYFEEDAAPIDVRRILFVEGKTLLFVTPVVAIEVMLYASWGIAGFAIAFVPVLILAYAMRSNVESAQQNVELLRRNRELAILTESSTQILSAETDHETLRRLMSLLSKLARMKACAVVTWESNPDVAGTVYRFGECMPTDQEILRWVDSAGFAQSAPSRAFVFQSDMRKFPLSGGSAIQVLIGIQTPEVIYGILLFETEDLSILKAGQPQSPDAARESDRAVAAGPVAAPRDAREDDPAREPRRDDVDDSRGVEQSDRPVRDRRRADPHRPGHPQGARIRERRLRAVRPAARRIRAPRARRLDDVWEDVRKKHVSPRRSRRSSIPSSARRTRTSSRTRRCARASTTSSCAPRMRMTGF
jgi:hypothetical protein